MLTIKPRWKGEPCVIAAPGPSLTNDVVSDIRDDTDHRLAVACDAYRLFLSADLMYAADRRWWNFNQGCKDFMGERWGANAQNPAWNLNCVEVRSSHSLSKNPRVLHGVSSGLQLLNMILLMGASPIILVGFDMRVVNGKRHFFGDHPAPLTNDDAYESWAQSFDAAYHEWPNRIINATPGSALKSFETMTLYEALDAR